GRSAGGGRRGGRGGGGERGSRSRKDYREKRVPSLNTTGTPQNYLLQKNLVKKVSPPVSGLGLSYGQHCGRENGNTPAGEGAAHLTSGMTAGARYPEGERGQHRAPIVKHFSVRET